METPMVTRMTLRRRLATVLFALALALAQDFETLERKAATHHHRHHHAVAE